MHERRVPRHRRSTTGGPGRAVLVAVVGLVGGTLLNAQAMLTTARQLELGTERDVAVAVMEPVADLSHALRLDRPRQWLDDALDRGTAPVPAPRPSPTLSPVPSSSPGPTSRPSPTPTALRTPTRADPLQIAIVGDSMAQVSGQSLIRLAEDLGAARAELDFRFSSGLTRPDFFDWPAHLAELAAARRPPEAYVVFFGANDAQGMVSDGAVLRYGSAAWDRAYAGRVDAVMAQLTAAGAWVYWVGQPVARPSSYSARMAHLDALYRAAAARHPGVRYVDSWPLFLDSHGRYSAYLETRDGLVLMRQADGIHLSRAGGDRLAAAILATLRLDWRLP